MRIVILGAGGRLGKALVRRLKGANEVIELARDSLDLKNQRSIHECLDCLDFDLLILAAAMTAVDYCESNANEAFEINAEGPFEIARVCELKRAKVVYISTDFVFDGTKATPYIEADDATPASVYGASKLKGEEYVLNASGENMVVRVSWLYGLEKPAFPEWIVQQAMTYETLALPGEKKGSPTSCEDLAMYIESLIDPILGGSASGIVHLCNSGSCSWQEWGQFCIDAAIRAGLDVKAQIIQQNCLDDITAFVAKRPINSVLNTDRFTSTTGIVPRSWQDAMTDHFASSFAKGLTR